ncbi:PLP-dependent cysteine synthase family protein [Lentzea sp. NEAU-D7]|uniref:PLP-dependent cysteine synthase family protein n=1 Tax=Lentzea sp. NEAU-D7 TaxID=2994667 RepID=UPI00224AA81A|nr:cysteine synthase family protein [Lentzea sp. NEAU-D7]MCX2952900.1 cysteine synthase family protein [Lentzea sp. NEAU-D7]
MTATLGTQRVAESIDDLVGNTPLLRLPTANARVLAKLESANPGSSVKDRAALWMLRGAERDGLLTPGSGTVIEATSGNTGIALAALSAARSYRCVIVLPDNATRERIGLLRALGAQVVLTPAELRYQGCIDRARELHEETPGSWFPQQHANPDNPAAHFESTGPEIWADTAGTVDVLVAGIGTGGTLCGTAAYLKSRNPLVRAVGVEPEGSPLLSRGYAGSHAIPGLNGGFVADTTDVALIDDVLTVSDQDAANTALWLARQAGVLAGISSGAAAFGALRVAERPENEGKTIVTILPDTGERYLSVLTSADTRGTDR